MKSTYQNKDWDSLSAAAKAEVVKVAIQKGIYSLDGIKDMYNEFAMGGSKKRKEEVSTDDYSVGNLVNALYQTNPREEYLGEPSHHYDFTQSEEWANTHGYYPDARGHRDDRVKKPAHPSHPSRGTWDKDKFVLTDLGMQNSNYTMFGLVDGGQDPQATLIYRDGIVLPEITVTPQGNYFFNPYDNIRLNMRAGGGKINTAPLGRRYWQAQSNAPTILEKKNTWVKQQKVIKDRKDKALRNYLQTEGARAALNKEVKDYLTTSNDNTWTTSNRNPKNPHLQDRVTKGAKSHALWEKEHPVLSTWGNVLGAVPFAVALAPLAAAAGSGIAALAGAAAATSAGQAITAGLAPLATAASTSVAGAPLYTWADVGLSSLFGAHGVQTAINEGGISPTTALERATLGRLAKPMFNEAALAIKN
jgi:hypothetical protein